ncbi:ATP-NAD kinase [Halohasta salina]|uniref:ATP-NAD kinase n=1 Tax=Halohasta salina TaxID=2961621 RepID=UPI0020A2763A|nr:ATP-NAD kinase [Halohasta salina]
MTLSIALAGVDDHLAAAIDAADGLAVDPDRADLLVTVGEDPLTDCAARGESRPILPAGLDADWSPDPEAVPELVAGETVDALPTVEATPLAVSVGDTAASAAFDVTLVTSEPARISEYTVSVDGRTHATFRADGVVVATPLGSGGYARAAGGPQLAFGTGLAVVPIAPFATIADAWVLQPPLSIRVERDDAVDVFADTDRLAAAGVGFTADIEPAPALSLVDCRNWKNSNESLPHS